jgi:hypothetical protein
MAVIFKITNGDQSIEFYPPNENNAIPIWIGNELDPQSWDVVEISKDEAREMITHLQKLIKQMD